MVPSVRMILASESPRRRELLAAVGVPFRVVPSGVDEIPRPGESPPRFVRRAALDKGEAVAALHPSSFVLSADTIVVADGRILGKPRDRAEARRMLSRLAGREHRVHTAICLLCRERGAQGGVAATYHDHVVHQNWYLRRPPSTGITVPVM